MVDLHAPLSDVRLLIIEDEPLISLMVEDFAVELGCQSYQTAASVDAALAAIVDFAPQIALVDCSLSHGGPDFIVADALDDGAIPFIFTSGHHSNILPVRHRDRDFLAKPFSMDSLKEAIIRIRLKSQDNSSERNTTRYGDLAD